MADMVESIIDNPSAIDPETVAAVEACRDTLAAIGTPWSRAIRREIAQTVGPILRGELIPVELLSD